MKKEYPNLDVQTCTCVMHSNEDTIFDWYDFLKYDLKPDKININYIRPPSNDPIELEFDHNRYAELSHMILEDVKNSAIKNNYGGKSGFFKAAVDIYMHDLIAKTKETGEAQLTCYAGSAGAVIYDEGTISSCENLDSTGNLRDYDWDFQKAWTSPAMEARRKKAADGCFCTHESNCYYPTLPFNSKHLGSDQKTRTRDEKGEQTACSKLATRRRCSGIVLNPMANTTPKILIISSDTGGGHRSAAQAVSEGLQPFLARRVDYCQSHQGRRRITRTDPERCIALQLDFEKPPALDEILLLVYQ